MAANSIFGNVDNEEPNIAYSFLNSLLKVFLFFKITIFYYFFYFLDRYKLLKKNMLKYNFFWWTHIDKKFHEKICKYFEFSYKIFFYLNIFY